MGNIVTPDQGFLPLPSYADAVASSYPWWLNTALAIWALLALLCCWLLLLLYLLRYCCKRWRQRQYAADHVSLRERIFGSGGAKGRSNIYATNDHHFETAPLPPVPPYAMSDGNERAFRDIYEHRTVHDDFYGGAMPYVTAAGIGGESGSESYFEEGIIGGNKKADNIRLLANGLHPITVVSEKPGGAITENIEHNITRNYIINEEQNYFIQKDPVSHDQNVQRLPGPTVTTINMAAERITDDPNWEKTNLKDDFDPQTTGVKQASAQIVKTDPSLFQQDVKYEKPPNVLTHRPPPPPPPPVILVQSRKLGARASITSDDDHGSTTSEMSGHDSESIYETIRVFTPKKQALAPLEDEDVYDTAGIDEVEIEIKDLVRLQKANPKSSRTYDDILSSTNQTRRHLTPHLSSSISSSSTLNNLVPANDQGTIGSAAEEKEETVTETIKTQQIQTTFHQIGQHLDDSAFFIPLTSSSTTRYDDEKIRIPLSSSTIRHEEKPALRYNRDQ